MAEIECMVCEQSVSTPKDSFRERVGFVVHWKDWAMSEGAHGLFLCCPDCYSKAFDLSKGGKVGFLRPRILQVRATDGRRGVRCRG